MYALVVSWLISLLVGGWIIYLFLVIWWWSVGWLVGRSVGWSIG